MIRELYIWIHDVNRLSRIGGTLLSRIERAWIQVARAIGERELSVGCTMTSFLSARQHEMGTLPSREDVQSAVDGTEFRWHQLPVLVL